MDNEVIVLDGSIVNIVSEKTIGPNKLKYCILLLQVKGSKNNIIPINVYGMNVDKAKSLKIGTNCSVNTTISAKGYKDNYFISLDLVSLMIKMDSK